MAKIRDRLFRKKKKEEGKGSGIGGLDKDDGNDGMIDEIIDFNDFKDLDEADLGEGGGTSNFEKGFIFHISNGCPICGRDVKGNDYFRYFCENCNLLFDKKDIIESEFGRSFRGVRKTRLTDAEREELEKKRKELKDRIFRTFSDADKRKLVEEAERREKVGKEEEKSRERDDEKPSEKEEKKEEEKEGGEKEEAGSWLEEEGEKEREYGFGEAEPEGDADGSLEGNEEEGVVDTMTIAKKDFGLESPDRIIASTESTKMHKGDCHFVRKIHPENRVYLESVEDGLKKGYDMCVCLRRARALQR